MSKVKSINLLTIAAGLGCVVSTHAQACVVSRDDIVKTYLSGASQEEVAAKFVGCTAVEGIGADTPLAANSATTITNTGSTYYEALTSCGYHPQRKEVTCPIEIRQRFGFGGVPALQPAGSYEFVLFCVDPGTGMQPVNTNGVHVHDEAYGAGPTWQMTSVVAADADKSPNLFSRPLRGQTMRARAILSWGLNPLGNCNFNPIWGNQADFRIRLDP